MDGYMDENEIRYENMLLSILQNEKQIEPFLDVIFRFLYKKTDFYLICDSVQKSYGFRPGQAKEMVLKSFEKYNKMSKDKIAEKIEGSGKKTDEKKQETVKKEAPVAQHQAQQPSISIPTQTSQPTNDQKPEEKSELKSEQVKFQSNPDSYNGAIRDNYSWSQTIKDIDVKVRVNKSIIKSKDIKIKIEKQSLKVEIKSDDGKFVATIDDKLPWKIKPDECTWTLHPGDHIHINLEKCEERWWEKLLENETKLDLKNMNPEKPLHDLEPEAQAKIQQLMYDQNRKRLGLPTSEEENYHDLLKKAWNAEGSPFAGQPFDPSKVKVQNGNINIDQ